MAIENGFESWAIIELFGHSVIAGLVTEQEIGGAAMLRVDVPEVDDQKGFTRFFNHKAVYSITPVDEDTAMIAIRAYKHKPVETWKFADMVKQLTAGVVVDAEDDDDGDFDGGYRFTNNKDRDRYADDLDF